MLDICSFVSRNFKVHHDGMIMNVQILLSIKHVIMLSISLIVEGHLFAYKKLKYFLINPRLQRLFISLETVEYMIWHHSYDEMMKLGSVQYGASWVFT
jgi:hypothetical protein